MRTVHTGAHFGYMCAQGNPPMWISFPLAIAESQAILEEEDRRQREADRCRQAKESPRLVAQIRAERVEELACASKATNFLRELRARAFE